MEWNGCKHFVYFCVCEILKVQSHFWLILTADPDGLMVEISTYDPHLISGSTPRVAQWLIIEWNGCKHFVYFCVCEILKVQSNFWLILTADPDGLMVVINTCDPHLVSGSTPRVAQWLIMEWNGCKHFVYFCVCEILKVQSHFWLILTADPDGSAVRISQKWLWTFNISHTQKYTKCLHPFHSIISHCATLGVDPDTRWGSHVFMTTIKPSGSAVRISQKLLWTFNISHTQKYTKCLHPFHSIISHCATLGVDPEISWGSYVLISTIKPSGSAVRISKKWLWTFNISHTQKYTKCLHPFHSIISHCATLGVDPETRWGSYVLMTTIKPSGSAIRI